MKWYLFHIPSLDISLYEKWYALLAPQKKNRVDSFHFEEDKHRLVFADMLAKLALSEYTGFDAEHISLGTHSNGKPYAIGLPAEFNISHSGELIACAVDSERVGIDIEKIRPIPAKLVYRVCSEQEYAYIGGDTPVDKQSILTDRHILERFYQVWTAKEAYTKYTGTGLAADLQQIPINKERILTTVYGEYVISICCNLSRANNSNPLCDDIWTFYQELSGES